MSNRLRGLNRNGKLERGFIKERYGKSKQLRFLNGHPLIPIGDVQTRDAQHKKKTVNRYTPEGRAEIHKNLGVNTDTMIWLMRTPVLDKSIEFADNRISLFAAQYGRCAITGTEFIPHQQDRDKSTKKSAHKGVGERQSVLQALRSRQAKQKAQEKSGEPKKAHTHKKGEQEL